MSRMLLAIDHGTTSSRAILFDEHLRQVASAQREFPQYFPQDGWVEHDAEEIWDSVARTVGEVLGAAHVRPSSLAGVGITNQRETVVVWERATSRPIGRAIVWQDRRTAARLEHMKTHGLEDTIRRKTGLLPDPYFSASKLAWLLESVPDGHRRAADGELAAGTMDTWLIWKLSGGKSHVTDVSNASRTMLMDLRTGQWDEEMLNLFGIPRAVLPQIVPSSGILASVEGGLVGCEVPVAAAVGDQQSALFGQLCTSPGMVKCTYGTGCFMLLFTGREPVESRHRLLTTVAWQLEGQEIQYALEGSVFMGGASIQWLRDGLGIIRTAPEVNELAARVPNSEGVVLVPAFTGLGAPYWDSSARGLILGLNRATTAAHIARATLDGIAHQVTDQLLAMQKDAGSKIRVVRTDGGASASDLLMQIQANLLGIPLERPQCVESTALGAAMLAGLGVNMFPDASALASMRAVERTFHPTSTAAERRTGRKAWSRAVKRARAWAE